MEDLFIGLTYHNQRLSLLLMEGYILCIASAAYLSCGTRDTLMYVLFWLVHIRTPANSALEMSFIHQRGNSLTPTGPVDGKGHFLPASSPTTYLSGVANRTGSN
jgi:hypothetical protein